jgi:hypothetical protein
MDKHGKVSDNSEFLDAVNLEKIDKPSINSMLSANQFGHLRTTTDKNT